MNTTNEILMNTTNSNVETQVEEENIEAEAEEPIVIKKTKKWLRISKDMIIRITAIVAAIGALASGVIYIHDLVRKTDEGREEITQTKEQAKSATKDLANGVDALSEQIRQNHEDIVAIRKYIAEMSITLEIAVAKTAPRPTYGITTQATSVPLDLPAPPTVGPEPRKVEAKEAKEAF